MQRAKQTFYLNKDQIQWLHAESERTGAPVSELIRRALETYRAAKTAAAEERNER